MPQDEFKEKLEMCEFLGLLPLFPLRCPSELQYAQMKDCGGLALKFKTRIFPPGFQRLVTDIWNHFRLPVNIWEEILPPIEAVFLNVPLRRKATKGRGMRTKSMKIQTFHKPSSKAGIIDIFFSFYLFQYVIFIFCPE